MTFTFIELDWYLYINDKIRQVLEALEPLHLLTVDVEHCGRLVYDKVAATRGRCPFIHFLYTFKVKIAVVCV